MDFNRDIRPILAEHCFRCHGPDEKDRQGGLRLDTRSGALAIRDGGSPAMVPGDSRGSLLYQRITATDLEQRMPPVHFQSEPLSADQIARLRDWIDQGGTWDTHWAYVASERTPLPPVQNTRWPRNAIDYFTLARMESAGLVPAAEADKHRLVRRVTLTLTGLPPTPAEVAAFVNDPAPDAYDRLVDRLLASPQYGERMALDWLDLARYADTHGYHIDSHRDMWRWRDWVINAFNQNIPFDQFTIDQLAGDLLPEATLDQKIASGFHRNTMVNFEGGAIPEEYLAEYVADRVVTTSAVWLGQTMQCARCHDHKYDPITQREFYQLFAYFNNIAEEGLDGRTGNAKPFIKAPTPIQLAALAPLDERAATLQDALTRRAAESGPDQAEWERQLLAGTAELPKPPADVSLHFPLDSGSDSKTASADGKITATIDGTGLFLPGRYDQAMLFDGSSHIIVGDQAGVDRTDVFSYGAWIFPTTSDPATVFSRINDDAKLRGYELHLADRKVHAHLIHDWETNAIRVHTKSQVALSQWQHLMVTYDGSSTAAGVKIYVNGEQQELEMALDKLSESIKTEQPLHIGRRSTTSAFRGMIDEVRFYQRELAPEEVALLAGSNPIGEIAHLPVERRSTQQQKTLAKYYLEHEDAAYKELKAELDVLEDEQTALMKRVPTTMVMQELETPRETFVLARGDYRSPAERVAPGTPGCLPPLPPDAPPNRLGLARWLVMPDHPLTARVTVNHFWQLHFGDGLVRTPEDFGTRGDWPTHPELLDWLACELVASGWNMKHVHRLIVTSATFRQSSAIAPHLLQMDPENRLLARGPRQRLQAEMIRDSALSASGLLDQRLGGESVSPYQPPGLWEEMSSNPEEFTAQVYTQSQGADLYRRSMYTFWKRTVPPASMAIFDAPDRETCTVRRTPTNTPLQALVLMNDPTYIEAARKLAERLMAEERYTSDEQFVRQAFLSIVSRPPEHVELQALLRLLDQQRAAFAKDLAAADSLLQVGESRTITDVSPKELAAGTVVVSVILSLDEAISRY